MGEKQLDPTVIPVSEDQATTDYLRAEVAKLNAELREMASENAKLKDLAVKLSMKLMNVN